MFRRISLAVLASAVALVIAVPPSTAAAQQTPAATATPADTMVELRNAAVKFAPIEVPGFKKGLQIAVLNGDPEKEGPYTIRLRFPAGYAFPAHWHPMAENLTVVSGRFFLGMGEKTNPKALKAYAPGDFLAIPAKMAHFGRVQGLTVIQLHGQGPFQITVVEPATGTSQ